MSEYGSFGEGFSSAFGQQQQLAQKNAALQQQQQLDLTAQINKNINDLYATAAAVAKANGDAGNPPEAIANQIHSLQSAAVDLATNAANKGVFGQNGQQMVGAVNQRFAALSGYPAVQDKTIIAPVVTGEDPITGQKTIRGFNKQTGAFVDIPGANNPPSGGEPARPGQTNLTGPNTTSTVVGTQDIPPGAPAVASSVPSPNVAMPTPSFADRFDAVNAPAPSQVPIQTPRAPIKDSYGVVNNSNNAYIKQAIENWTTDWKQLDAEARRYNMGDNSVVTAYGRSTKGPMAIQRAAVIARGNDLMIAEGMNPGEVAGARAKNQALTKSLVTTTAMKTAVEAFSEFESKNLDKLGELAQKVDSTGIPAFERWIRAGKQATGDPDVAQFNFQYQLVKAGVARITQTQNLSGVLSDEARKEIEQGFPGSSNVKQIMAIIGLAKGDFRRRYDALDSTIANVQSQFRGLGLPQGDTRKLTQAGLLSSTKNSRASPITPNAPPAPQQSNQVVIQNGFRYDAQTHQPLGPAQ